MLHRRLSGHIDQDIYPVQGNYPQPGAPELFIETVGIFRSRGDFYWEQISPYVALHFISAGKGTFEVDGRRYEASAGSVFLFWPGQHIRYWDTPESPWCYTWLTLTSNASAWGLAEAGLSKDRPHLVLRDARMVSRFVEDIVQTFRYGGYSPLYPVHEALRLLELLGSQDPERHQSPSDPLAERIRKLVDSNHLSIPTIEGLADTLKVDRTTIYRAFKERYKLSVKDYIDAARFDRACRLLAHPRTAIKEVAFACGFRDARYFSRAFRKRFGQAPGAWRKARAQST
jgi:AraC-like DNA-binding protein